MALLHKEDKHPINKPQFTTAQRTSDAVTEFVGSWGFIIYLSSFLILWVGANVLMVVYRWDPYPFILMNLFLSFLAAYQAPLILMSQNRAAERDRAMAKYDYQVNRKAEREIQDIQKDLESIKRLLKKK